MTELVDARGVEISPGDTVIYGFGVGRSVAMAEAVVLASEPCDGGCDTPTSHRTVSLTPSGRVRLRVVRRSWGGGQKPIVDVAPDRLVVLKAHFCRHRGPLPPAVAATHTDRTAQDRAGEMDPPVHRRSPPHRDTQKLGVPGWPHPGTGARRIPHVLRPPTHQSPQTVESPRR